MKATAKAVPPSSEKRTKCIKELDISGLELIEIRKTTKTGQDREKEIKAEVMPLIQDLGETDQDGHVVLNCNLVKYTLQKRTKAELCEETATDLLTKKKLLDEATSTFIDPDKIEQLYAAGKLTKDDVAEIMAEKVSYALCVERASK